MQDSSPDLFSGLTCIHTYVPSRLLTIPTWMANRHLGLNTFQIQLLLFPPKLVLSNLCTSPSTQRTLRKPRCHPQFLPSFTPCPVQWKALPVLLGKLGYPISATMITHTKPCYFFPR